MKKIIVIGSPGAGKSVLSRHLRDKLGIPLYYLDCIFWKENWCCLTREELVLEQQKIFKNPSWIIDGNYIGTLELRFQNCDTAIFLDLPVEDCIESVITRRGKKREDLPQFLEEKEDLEFIEFIRAFPIDSIPKIWELKEKYPNVSFYHFTSREEAHKFIDEI